MIILRQKNYNIISDIRYSGIKRTLRKSVGRARKKLAEKLDKSIENDLNNMKSTKNEGTALSRRIHKIPETTELARKELQKIAKTENIKINRDLYANEPVFNRAANELSIPYDISLGELNHELGHVKAYKGKRGIINKWINKLGQSNKNLRNLNIINSLTDPRFTTKAERKSLLSTLDIESDELQKIEKSINSAKLSDAAKRFINGKLLVQDEKNASKWSLKRIKNKLSPEVYKLEKRRQKAANEGYRYAVRASNKIPIRNKIQIPSKRGDFKIDVR